MFNNYDIVSEILPYCLNIDRVRLLRVNKTCNSILNEKLYEYVYTDNGIIEVTNKLDLERKNIVNKYTATYYMGMIYGKCEYWLKNGEKTKIYKF